MWNSRQRWLAAWAAGLLCFGQAAQATDVGVSVTVGQPGFYGRIDLGSAGPAPRVVYREPQWVVGRPVRPERHHVEPWYLYVPPGHARHWARHCAAYGACGRPVYFVEEAWYRQHYGPRREDGGWREDGRGERDGRHGHGHGHGHGKHRGHGHEH